MTRGLHPRRHFLDAVDRLCDELRATCGLTRFTLVVRRPSSPLAITFEDSCHRAIASWPHAELRIDLDDGERALGHVTVEDARSRTFSREAEAVALHLLRGHLGELASLIPEMSASPTVRKHADRVTEHA